MSHSDGMSDWGSGEQATPPPQSTDQPIVLPTAEEVERAQFRGLFYRPATMEPAGDPLAAVIALPDPDEGIESLNSLVAQLLEARLAVLALFWNEEPTYPEILAILPGAIEFLISSVHVDPNRIGVLGVELGADLAIRAASTDPQIASVMAYAPYLSTEVIDAGLITRIRRPRLVDWERLVEQIGSMAALRKLVSRQIKLIFGEKDRLIDVPEVMQRVEEIGIPEGIFILEDGKHDEIIVDSRATEMAQQWFLDTLVRP